MKDYADHVNRRKRHVASIHTVHDYVNSDRHNVINFAQRQEARKRRNQGPRRYWDNPGPEAA